MTRKIHEEFVDVVDKKDHVLYYTTKAEAHQKGSLHRTIISELINSKGEWTLVKQSSDRQDPGEYVSPMGGHMRSGETEKEALKREMLEELGLQNFQFQFIGKAIYRRTVGEKDENHYFILYESFSDETPTLNHESVGYKTFSKDELKSALKNHPRQFGAAFTFVVKTFYPQLTS